MEIIRKQAAWIDLKMAGDATGPGSGEGWGSIYGNTDRDEEIMAPGVFAESLSTFLRDGFLGLGHDWRSGVGTFTDAKESDQGLYVAWEWHSDPEAQLYRQRVAERLTRGKSVGLSVGFRVQESTVNEDVRDKWGMPQRTITKAELFEVSIVTVPSNPLARVTDAKGQRVIAATIREFEEFLREAGYSRSQAEAIASKGFKVLDAGQGEPAPDTAAADSLAAEYRRFMEREARQTGVLA